MVVGVAAGAVTGGVAGGVQGDSAVGGGVQAVAVGKAGVIAEVFGLVVAVGVIRKGAAGGALVEVVFVGKEARLAIVAARNDVQRPARNNSSASGIIFVIFA